MDESGIGKKIAEFRKRRGLQQEEFADRIGVSRQALSQWETGKQIPRSDKIQEICSVFGVSAQTFYGEEGQDGAPVSESKQKTDEKRSSPFLDVLKTVLSVWNVLRGWLLIGLGAFAAIALFIIYLSPNNNATTVRVWNVDVTALFVLFLFVLVVAIILQIARTVLYFFERRGADHEKKN